jgi:DNA recombination protein RmuC
MDNSVELLYLFLGIVLGGLVAGLWVYNRFVGSGRFITADVLAAHYIAKDVFAAQEKRLTDLETELAHKQLKIIELHKDLAAIEQINAHLEEKLIAQKTELTELQKRFQIEFENIANKLLEEKTERFTHQNQTQLNEILNPLREKIKDFELNIERKFLDETRERVSLKSEIENLRLLNQQLSTDAHNLASALRGDSKTQGDWGELQVERLLEKAGLLRGVHFETQMSFWDETGAQRRPDFVIQLPENKQLILDAKVSLTAFEQFFNADEPSQKARFLKAHIESLRNHVRTLGDKNYIGLNQVNTPDYVVMFVPIEPALAIAIQEDPSLFNEALDKNVVIVTPSTMLITMRTVSFIWKQENQKKHVLEIARQSGLLYDKFVAFVEDLRQIGQRLDMAQSAYQDAMNKLTDSRKYGDTLIGRAEKIRELGAKAAKRLPQDLIE